MPVHLIKFVAMLAMIAVNVTVFFYAPLSAHPDLAKGLFSSPLPIGEVTLPREVQLAYLVGAMGYPLFCFALAWNFAWNTRDPEKMVRRFAVLTLFAELARIPAVFLIGFWPFHGIFLPMLAGLLLCQAHYHGWFRHWWAVVAAALALLTISAWLPFAGSIGALVVFGFYLLARYDNGPAWAVSALAVYLWVDGLGGAFSSLAPLTTAGVFLAVLAGKHWTLPNRPRLPKAFWYSFYPGVMLVLAASGYVLDRHVVDDRQVYAYEWPSVHEHWHEYREDNALRLAWSWGMGGDFPGGHRGKTGPAQGASASLYQPYWQSGDDEGDLNDAVVTVPFVEWVWLQEQAEASDASDE